MDVTTPIPSMINQTKELQMSETIPQLMVNAATGEQFVLQLKPRSGLTAAEVTAFLADRKEAAKRIAPLNCEVMKWKAKVLDPYGLLEVESEWSCVGSELFVRNLP